MDTRRYVRPLTLLALGIAVGLLGATAFYLAHQSPGDRAVGATQAAPAIPGPPVREASGAKHIQPVTLSIPAIELNTTLVDLVLNADRTLRPPTDYQTAGWFSAGPAPGDADGPPAVLAVRSVTGGPRVVV